MAGNYGITALARESLLVKTDADGKYLIDDGKCSITVLTELEVSYKANLAASSVVGASLPPVTSIGSTV